jgi:tetratricopeptide (TPR) repeat protein
MRITRRLAAAAFAAGLLALLCGVLQAASPGREALDRGVKLYKEGRYKEAIEALKDATSKDPGLLAAWENLGWAYHRAGRHQEAIQTWRTVLKVAPRHPELLNEIGAIQLGQGQWNEAAESLERSLALSADQPKVRLRLADAYEHAGRLQDAEAQLREALRLGPYDLAVTLRLQEFLERNGRVDAALKLMHEASSRLAPYEGILKLRAARLAAHTGDDAYRRGNYQAARDAYLEAVRSDPSKAQYRINLGWAQRKLGALSEASAAWREALQLEPGHSALYKHIADAALEQEDLSVAAAMYNRAWAESERQPSIPYRLAEIAFDDGRADDAALWLAELFALPDADAEWSRRVAGLFARAEQAGTGIDFFEGRLQVSQRPAETRGALSALRAARGSSFYQAAEMEKAMRELEQAVRLDPKNPHALRDLGWVYYATENWDACAKIWGRYATAYPEHPQPQNLLTQLRLKRKDYAAAVDSARASLKLDAKQPEQRLKLARALYASGQFAEARPLAEAVAKESPDSQAAQVFWGELLMQYHDFARGKEQWRRVLDMGVHTPKAEFYWVKSMYELGEYQAAVAEAERLLQPDAAKQPLLQFLADDAVLRDDAPQGIRWYRLMVQHFPERLSAWLELARLSQLAGDLAGARSVLDEARRRFPDRLDVALAQAELDRRAGRSAEAYAAFVALSRDHATQRDVFWGRLQTAVEAGRAPEALSVLRGAGQRTLLKGYEARMQEARILFAMGQDGRAQAALADVIDPPRGTIHVPILLYHGLGDHPLSASLPVALFDSQMKALAAEGWTAVTMRELHRMLQGKQPYAKRPILITFDDARIDSFEKADPVLARYGLKATMFVPTARILDGHPFFADWGRIRGYAANGRWDLQSHGHQAHDPISVGPEQNGSFLVNRKWLEEENRLESYEEYRARLDADHRQVLKELAARFPELELSAYAFPFSEAGQENVGNEPRAAETNEQLLTQYFRYGLVQDESGYNELGSEPPPGTLLRRYAVPRTMDGKALLEHLARHAPPAAALAESARMYFWRGEYDRSRVAWERLGSREPGWQGEAAYYLAGIQYQKGRYDVAHKHLRAAEDLGSERLKADPGLGQRIRWESGARLVPRVDFGADSDDRENSWQGAELHAGALGPADLSFAYGRVSLRQEGLSPLDGNELSVQASVGPVGHWTLEGRAWQRRMETAGDTLSFRAGLGFANDWLALRVRGGREDVETLGARLLAIQSERYAGHALLRLAPDVMVVLDGAYGRQDDGNKRRDLSGRFMLRPRWGYGLSFGLGGGWSDMLFQSDLYYSPADVRWARLLVGHDYRAGAGWLLESEMGLGWATDTLRGRRRTFHGAVRAGQEWGGRMRTIFDLRYGNSPGYESWGLGGSLQIRF